MTYAGYTREDLMQMALNAPAVTLDREIVLDLLAHIDDLRLEMAEEKATIAVLTFER